MSKFVNIHSTHVTNKLTNLASQLHITLYTVLDGTKVKFQSGPS